MHEPHEHVVHERSDGGNAWGVVALVIVLIVIGLLVWRFLPGRTGSATDRNDINLNVPLPGNGDGGGGGDVNVNPSPDPAI